MLHSGLMNQIPSLLSLFLRRRIRRFKWRSHFAASNIATRAVVMEHLPMQLARQEPLALLIEAAFHEKQRIRGENFFPAPFAPKDDSHIRISRSFSFLLQLHYPRALCSSMLELLSSICFGSDVLSRLSINLAVSSLLRTSSPRSVSYTHLTLPTKRIV